jgi:hypothetical protein
LIDSIIKFWVMGQIFLYGVAPIIFVAIGIPVLIHELSGGYWPKWYWNLKQRKQKADEDANPITLNLNK